MKVKYTALVENQGMTAFVDAGDIPKGGLRVGILVHQGDLAWKVKGIVSVEAPSPDEVGLVLQPEGNHDISPSRGALLL